MIVPKKQQHEKVGDLKKVEKLHKAAEKKSQKESVKDEYKYCHAGLMT